MSKDKIDELEQKKRELEEELERIQNVLDDSIIRVRKDLGSQLDPKKIIRRFPFPLVGASVLLGFLVGYKRNHSDSEQKSPRGEVSQTLFSEIKKLATRKAVHFASDYLEKLVNEKKKEHLSASQNNGSSE